MVDSFIAGVVGAPFGLKGFVKIHVPSGETEHLEALESARLRIGGAERNYEIEDTGGASSSFVMKFRGVDTPEAAKLLRGAEIIVPRDAAAPLDRDEFYIEDLRGLQVVLLSGEGQRDAVGTILDVVEGGGGQLIEIRTAQGAVRLVPFRNEFFGDIDLGAKTAILREGWILE